MYNMVKTDIICPACGECYMTREEPKVIKSNTETYAYLCTHCGFVHVAKSDEDMKDWIQSLDKPIEPVIEINGRYYKPKTESEMTNYDAKHDEGKLQIHLVPPQIIRDIAEVRMYGNDKYGDPDNWKTVEKWRYVDALLRHLLLYLEDPDGVDEESGIKHYKHAACNMAFICSKEANQEEKKNERNNRMGWFASGRRALNVLKLRFIKNRRRAR